VTIAGAFNVEIFDLRSHVLKAAGERDRLARDAEALEGRLRSAEETSAALDRGKTVIATLETELAQGRTDNEELCGSKAEIAQLRERQAQSSEASAAHERQLEALPAEIGFLRDAEVRYELQTNALQTTVAERDTEIARLKAAVAEQSAVLRTLCAEGDQLGRGRAAKSADGLRREIGAMCAELTERRARDGTAKRTADDRDVMLGDIGALELHIFELGQRGAALTAENAGAARKIARLESERIAEKERWMAAVGALECEKREFETVVRQQRDEIDGAAETILSHSF
jgi:chromosome segregation ATPase